jgi:hypothetical protein
VPSPPATTSSPSATEPSTSPPSESGSGLSLLRHGLAPNCEFAEHHSLGFECIPPADINPHLCQVSRVSTRRGRTAADGHHYAPSGALVDPGVHGSVLRCQRPLNGPAQRRVELAFAAPAASSGLARYGSFYRSPSSVPSREVHDLDPSQVHPRSVRGQRKLARTAQPEAGLSVVGRCILQPCSCRKIIRAGGSQRMGEADVVRDGG